MTKRLEFIRRDVCAPVLLRALRPLACSLAIHLGLGARVVFAGAMTLSPPQASRVTWLDLVPVDAPAPPSPPPPSAVSARRAVRPPVQYHTSLG